MPIISLVLPTYNVAQYIERCLKSCISQTYHNIEIIIVDDCGTDNSIDLATKYANSDSRIKIIKNKINMGTFHARRIGVENSSAPFILFLDPDDEIELHTVERIVSNLRLEPDLLFYGSRRVPKSNLWNRNPEIPLVDYSMDKDTLIKKILATKRLAFGTEGKVIKKSVLLDAYKLLAIPSSEHLVYGEDALLFFAILLEMNKASSLSDILYIYYRNVSSVTRVNEPAKIRSNLDQLGNIINKIKQIERNSEIEKFVKNKISNRLYVDSLNLKIQLENDYSSNFKNYLKICTINKDLKSLVKFAIYTATYGNKKI